MFGKWKFEGFNLEAVDLELVGLGEATFGEPLANILTLIPLKL